ncbi:hypothetical protein, partial [Pseudomonas aeruginosa]|uniref:hypothetical protein n=1 Tax=Pseudomonas aeruginosa TaxID=287 RepID=UPI002B413A00
REGRPDQPRQGNKGQPRPDRNERGPRPDRGGPRPQQFEAHPPREDSRKRIDPDNPFAAALAGFKPK